MVVEIIMAIPNIKGFIPQIIAGTINVIPTQKLKQNIQNSSGSQSGLYISYSWWMFHL
jgi:hypothetical protein